MLSVTIYKEVCGAFYHHQPGRTKDFIKCITGTHKISMGAVRSIIYDCMNVASHQMSPPQLVILLGFAEFSAPQRILSLMTLQNVS